MSSVTTRYPSVDALLEEVSRGAGLGDYGDPDFREGLARFLGGLERETTLSDAAAAAQLAELRLRMTNRLEIERWHRDHPGIAELPLGPMTTITGLPRTGTTALCTVMSLDPAFRKLRRWEQLKSCPPPVAGQEESDPRRQVAIAAAEAFQAARPDIAAMHIMDPDATEEDVDLLGAAGRSQQAVLPIYSYHHWWREADMRPAFAFHRRVLQLLQSRCGPDSWFIKSPAHNFHLDAFYEVYPNSRTIITHRDPAKVVPSVISLMGALQPEGSTIDPIDYGRRQAAHFRAGVERSIAARARIGEAHFLDVHQRDFVADPMGTLERIYAFLGRDLTAQVRASMEAWHAQNRTGARGTHHYTAEQFGLTEATIRDDFAFYIDRFDIRIES
jgi:Sulfotransferase family